LHLFGVFSYLDAGTGSVVIQSIIGIAAGVGVFGRKAISGVSHKIKGVFSKSESSNKTTSEKS
jgi:hypothetical protein